MPLQFSCGKTAVLSEIIMFSPLPSLSSKSTTERKTQTYTSSNEVQSQIRRSFCSLLTVYPSYFYVWLKQRRKEYTKRPGDCCSFVPSPLQAAGKDEAEEKPGAGKAPPLLFQKKQTGKMGYNWAMCMYCVTLNAVQSLVHPRDLKQQLKLPTFSRCCLFAWILL